MQIGVLTGGGDCPGLNAAIRGVVRQAARLGWTTLGFREGWAGVLDREAEALTIEATDPVLDVGGTMLGSSRTNPLRDAASFAKARAVFDDCGLRGLVVIGGDDTLSVAGAMAAEGDAVVGIPKTIDNDVPETDICIGFDTAVTTVSNAVGRVRTTAVSHRRVVVVETMGRDAGWLAAEGGLAGRADYIAVPERPIELATLVSHVEGRATRGLPFSVIVVAEGAEIVDLEVDPAEVHTSDEFGHVQLSARGLGYAAAGALERALGRSVPAVVLGYTQRGGPPTPFDRVLGTRCGVAAVGYLASGAHGVLTALQRNRIVPVPLADVAGRTRRLDASYLALLDLFD